MPSSWPAVLAATVLVPAALLAAGCAASPSERRPAAPDHPVVAASRPADAVPPGENRSAGEPERPARVPYSASGRYRVAPGQDAPPTGGGRVTRYLVEVERGLPFTAAAFAEQVHRTLNDPRGWGRFRRVDHGPVRLRVALTSPALTDRLCLPLRTGGELSCWRDGRSVINALRWARGVPHYSSLPAYRQYVISHEVGHGLGHGHRSCPGRGRRAPVMLQQTKSLYGCRPNPWPHPG
ncbi:DUF3152 domain-containing protein [Nonomuraea sp. NPDC050328]|uniref:DUF3152 domain-containing protein n=1 Tax=Nonomuraea sp. NPDC050328 TaxID=3364361 RepID=UPI00379FFC56